MLFSYGRMHRFERVVVKNLQRGLENGKARDALSVHRRPYSGGRQHGAAENVDVLERRTTRRARQCSAS